MREKLECFRYKSVKEFEQ